ncbi:hypothetical protein LshimejAT787_1102400 [Lyophyllum shimeji]|uniref:MYND-type domain-containing protein n=1 Tax=Lyophyllum shimeji TaxID=47721 RepID=A0A9P3PSY6_LYOSH|nr:hypothetical protein LshimejAT787_1102400 [Lyophyllum shimeji]
MMSSSKSAICGGCNKLSKGNLSRCSGCKQTMYCSRECQKSNWSSHKEICKSMRNAEGEAPKRSNPVIAIGRRVNQCEALLKLVDYVLIASLDLVHHPEKAQTNSVSLVCNVIPTAGSRVVNGKRSMTLRVVSRIHVGERSEADRVDQMIWVHYQWHPFPLPNVLYDYRAITPEQIEAFKSFDPKLVLRPIPPIANAAQKYVEYLNYHLRLPEYADTATTNVVESDYNDATDRTRSFLSHIKALREAGLDDSVPGISWPA